MKRNKILTTILALITLGFVGLMALLINNPEGKSVNQTVKQENMANKSMATALVNLRLDPFEIKTQVGQTFTVLLVFENLKQPISAADLILDYDPQSLSYVNTVNLSQDYLNPRNINENGRLVVSFVENAATSASSSLQLAQLNFSALQPGVTKIIPVINKGPKSSMVIVSGNNDNQLTSVNEVTINIK